MRIGLIISYFGIGGGSVQFLHLAQELKSMGHQPIIYCLSDNTENISPSLLTDLTIRSIKKSPPKQEIHSQLYGFLLYFFQIIKDCYSLSKLIEKDSLDVLNPHDWPIHWAAVMVKFNRNIPIVWMCNDVWHIPGEEEKPETRVIFRLGRKLIIEPIDKFITSQINKISVLSQLSA